MPLKKHHSRGASLSLSLEPTFEDTIQNKSLQPCDLNSFMDYLYYVERRAENLQFFLWFCDYVERWSRLPVHQRKAAPVWGPAEAAEAAEVAESAEASREASLDMATTPLVAAAGPAQPAPTYVPYRPYRPYRPYYAGHSRGPSASSSYRHHRSYSHSYVNHNHHQHNHHHRTLSTETVPYRPRSNSHASVATAASVSSLAAAALPRISIHQRADNDRLANILTLLENLPESLPTTPTVKTATTTATTSPTAITPREPPDWCLHYQQALLHEQPLRAEMDRVVAHYIDAAGPRALADVDLLAPERAACLRAAKHTTHPSALLPAFLAADSALREHSFPAFVRASCVGNVEPWSARWAASLAVAVLLLVTGAVLQALLVLRAHSNAPRLACLLLWWPALALLALGLCYKIDLVLYARGQRLLRAWEDGVPDSSESGSGSDPEKGIYTTRPSKLAKPKTNSNSSSQSRVHRHKASSSSSSSSSVSTSRRVDPLRKASLQAFGPRNDPDGEVQWMRRARVPLHRRVLGQLSLQRPRTAAVQHEGVRAMQKRAVRTAVMGAGIVSAVLVLGLLFVPVQ